MTRGVIGGFPCQDCSRCNSSARSDENRNAVLSGSLRTGSIFQAIVKLVSVYTCSTWALFENVTDLAVPDTEGGVSNLDACVFLLETVLKLFVFVVRLDPSLFGSITTRPRLYLLCLKRELLDKHGILPEVPYIKQTQKNKNMLSKYK